MRKSNKIKWIERKYICECGKEHSVFFPENNLEQEVWNICECGIVSTNKEEK